MTHVTWHVSGIAWMILIASVMAAIHAILSYTRAGTVASPAWVRAMLTLRLLIIATIAVAAFQPTLYLKRTAPQLPRLIVMIDNSESMRVIDQGATTSDLLSFAENVGKIDPEHRRRPLHEVINRVQQIGRMVSQMHSMRLENEQARTLGRLDEAARARAREQLEKVLELIAETSRFAAKDVNTGFVETRLSPLADALRNNQPVNADRLIEQVHAELRRRDSQADEQLAATDPVIQAAIENMRLQSRLDLARWAATDIVRSVEGRSTPVLQTLTEQLPPEELADLQADQPRSPLLQSLRRLIERRDSRDVQAVVLLTDGRSTEPRAVIPPMLSAAGVMVYPVLCGPADRQPDLRVVAIDAPASAMAGEMIPVTVRLRNRGLDGRTVQVKLSHLDKSWSQPVLLAGETAQVVFNIAATGVPVMQLKAEAENLRGEISFENNIATQVVEVVDQKINVMLIAATTTWEVEYLQRLLDRTPWVRMESQSLKNKEKCRFSAEQIEQQQVIVLAGGVVESLSEAQTSALHRAVSNKGGSILMMAVDPQALGRYASNPAWASILPYRTDPPPVWKSGLPNKPSLRPIPVPAAATLDMFSLDDQPDNSIRKWLARAMIQRVVEVSSLTPESRAILVDRSNNTPMMIESVVGDGRISLMLFDETWRWQRDEGDEAIDRFWLGMIRHLCEPRYDVVNDGMALGVDPTRIIAGRPVGVRGRTDRVVNAQVTFVLKQQQQVVDSQPASSLLPQSGRWTGQIVPPAGGDYILSLTGGGREISMPIHVEPADEMEIADVTPDPALLRRIASATGGRMFLLRDMEELKSLLASPASRGDDTFAYAVWCSPWVFGLIVACLGLEWVIRKQIGLI